MTKAQEAFEVLCRQIGGYQTAKDIVREALEMAAEKEGNH
jgi:hypothetical protein